MVRAASIQPNERRAEIMAVTERLIVEQGGTVSTRAIAEAAGIAEGTIFRVFPTKEAIFDAIFEDAFNPDLFSADLAAIDMRADMTTRMIALIAIMQRRIRRLMALFAALGFPSMQHKGQHKGKHLRHEQSVREIAVVLEPDRDRLRLAPREAARVMQAMVMAQANPLLGETPDAPEAIVDMILNGIARHPALSPSTKGPSC